jgi:hypothetical protein
MNSRKVSVYGGSLANNVALHAHELRVPRTLLVAATRSVRGTSDRPTPAAYRLAQRRCRPHALGATAVAASALRFRSLLRTAGVRACASLSADISHRCTRSSPAEKARWAAAEPRTLVAPHIVPDGAAAWALTRRRLWLLHVGFRAGCLRALLNAPWTRCWRGWRMQSSAAMWLL